ncbi:MAG: SGNH/GDSL hydrolase family protein [Solirubrobacteraceae bacterium]|nr:SGNH/GDSL hydrolase family protein [Solirubrobacteraceae bacterium]
MALSYVLAAVVAATTPAPAAGASYVAVGDSMTALDGAYPEQVATTLRAKQPSLRVRRLGCTGMTSADVIRGGGDCRYTHGTQLREAEWYLQRRRGRVDLVTVTIGANDVFDCGNAGDVSCLEGKLPAVTANVRVIARRLRRAAGSGATFVGTTYHDPFLGYWTQSREDAARASVPVLVAFNRALTSAYRAEGFRVADVGADFQITDFTAGPGGTPRNVALTCRFTLACPSDPQQFDVHPNDDGFARIARLVLRTRAQARG